MRLGIDLRFYRPEPYGLAVHIRDLMLELVPILQTSGTVTKVTLILDAQVSDSDLEKNLPWWGSVVNSDKFEIHKSTSKYYSLKEQTVFLKELYDLNLDLMYFFTFNFPIFYTRPFIYQVLDLSIPKTRSHLSPKIQAMLLCFRTGIARAKHIMFLGKNTQSDAMRFSSYQFADSSKPRFKPSTVIYNGINTEYLSVPSADEKKAKLVNLKFSLSKKEDLNKLRKTFAITKPYFFFISVWRKYKNIERLAEAFDVFNSNNQDKYQLVLGGGQDSKYPEILENIKQLQQYKKGNIIVTGRINNDEDVILLYDGAEALVAPSLSEGFGLWLVEAAVRGLPVIASDIPIFHEIANGKISYFDPCSVEDMVKKLQHHLSKETQDLEEEVIELQKHTSRFRWSQTAKDIISVIEKYA